MENDEFIHIPFFNYEQLNKKIYKNSKKIKTQKKKI